MAQRKLLLPPFHGERMKAYGELMTRGRRARDRLLAARARCSRSPRDAGGSRSRSSCARCSASRDGERLERLRDALRSMLDWTTDAPARCALVAAGPERMRARCAAFRRVIGPVDEVIADEIAPPPDGPDLAERDDVLSMLLQARHEDGSPMTRPRAARRAADAARRRPRDDRDRAVVGARAARPAPGKRGRGCATGDEAYVDAVIKETLRLRPVVPVVLRRLKAPMEIGGFDLPGGRLGGAVHLPHAPPRGHLPRPARVPPRALPRAARRHLHVDPVRRRRAALPRRELRPVRDGRRAARARAAAARGWSPTRLVPERTSRRSITLVPAREGRRARGVAPANVNGGWVGRWGAGRAVNVTRRSADPLRRRRRRSPSTSTGRVVPLNDVGHPTIPTQSR